MSSVVAMAKHFPGKLMLKKTLVARSLLAAFGTASIALAPVHIAHAQSNASGTLFGNVGLEPDITVVIESSATGVKRTVSPDANGRFQVTSLAPGAYNLQVLKGGVLISTAKAEVLIGQGVEAQFVAAGENQLETVQIVGRRSVIDTTTTNSSTTFTSQELARLPVGQDLTSIILLAPDTVKADPRYAGGASIGGGAPSENSYYINGFPVTNPLSQLGSIELPFNAIQQAQILTGGFGAEFGRSTGGVVNITTKSGTNKWEAGGMFYIEPQFARASPKNIYYPNTGYNSATDGKLYRYKADNTLTETKTSAYVGGPIIADKLFMFVAAEQTVDKRAGVGLISSGSVVSSTLDSNGWQELRDTNQRYLAKLDWNITDDHRLEFTALGDKYETDEKNYSFDYSTLTHGSVSKYSSNYVNQPNQTLGVGGTAEILRYVGNITPDLNLTALYGQSKAPHRDNIPDSLRNGLPGVVYATASAKAPGIDYGTPNPLSGLGISSAASDDSTKSFRLDVEYSIGKHQLRVGLDENRLKSTNAGDLYEGGARYSYRYTSTPNTARTFGPYTYVINDGGALSSKGYYVRKQIFSSITNARSDQSAQYIEDRYKPVKNLLVTLGLRNEGFSGYNESGEKFIDSKNFLSPRLGAAWDLKGDSSTKIFGNLGRYSIQTPTHIAVRGAGVSTLQYQYYTYTGVDANGLPTGLSPLTAAPYSPDGENGQTKDPNSVAAKNLKPSYQDELILGFEQALAHNLTFGTKLTYRALGNTLDDTCDPRPFTKYAADHGITVGDLFEANYSCQQFNPGRTNHFKVNYSAVPGGAYTDVTLTPSDFGFTEKPKRTYLALDFSLEHPFTADWYGKVTYTYSKSRGNTEGQTKSDTGQTDVSATSTWDFAELMQNAYGYLPSDRTHQIKALGYYQVVPEIGMGANLTVSSGRPKNCLGNYSNDPGYGSTFFYCTFDGTNEVATPRGSQGRLPWSYQLDVNSVYTPTWSKGLQLRVDVFNLLNKQSVLAIDETHELDFDPSSVLPTYGRVLSYSDPRAVRFTAQYTF